MELKEKIEQERLALEYMENELICEDFHFYNNGIYKTISSLSKEGWLADLKKIEPMIRIFGTRDEIEKALDNYIEMTGYNLDECYSYEIEEEGSFFYDKERNIKIAENLKLYKKLYMEQNLGKLKGKENNALITTI
tara:strand:+ start:152 stop:559 length:408 start_codon:yes stop_codon:yes gene_type:complete